jgi:hypothetical protein
MINTPDWVKSREVIAKVASRSPSGAPPMKIYTDLSVYSFTTEANSVEL